MAERTPKVEVNCTVNGEERSLNVYPMSRLLDVLREDLRLTGTKEGCGEGECGACSVLIDGVLVNSCLVPALQAEGTVIKTIEGIASGEQLHAVQEVGKVIHPVMASGQIEGGVAQGIGYTLFENVVWRDGRMINNQMTNYIIPTAADIPPIRVFFEENPYQYGPAGAKGIGELPMDGPAPAILNAIEHATGLSINHIPLMPEALMEALGGERG